MIATVIDKISILHVLRIGVVVSLSCRTKQDSELSLRLQLLGVSPEPNSGQDMNPKSFQPQQQIIQSPKSKAACP